MTKAINIQQDPNRGWTFTVDTFLLVVFFCFTNIVFLNSTFAQGVAAGSNILNTVVINYTIEGTIQTPIESSPTGNIKPGIGNGTATSFLVDRKIDLSVTGVSNANVTPGDTQSVITFILLNEGNDTQEFALSINSSLPTDGFDSSNCISTITAVSGTPLASITLPTTGSIMLKADQQASINVSCDIPLTQNGLALNTGDNALVSLIAIAEKNKDSSAVSETVNSDVNDEIETVYADTAGSDDIDRDASHSARREYITTSSAIPPNLTIDKSIVSIVDNDGGNSAISGSEVTYKITVSTSGNGDINNLIITDPTPIGMHYKNETIKLNNIVQSDILDALDKTDFGISNANTATINLGNITAGSLHEIQLTYIIN